MTLKQAVHYKVGVDYSPMMIKLCKKKISENESTKFIVVDATDLSQFYDNK